MPTYTMEGHDEGDNYTRMGLSEAELWANNGSARPKSEVWQDPELLMSQAAIGTRGLELVATGHRRSVGHATGHIIVRKAHIDPEQYWG